MTLQRKEKLIVTTMLHPLEKKTLSHHSKKESNNQHYHTRLTHHSPNHIPLEAETEGHMLCTKADEEDVAQEEDQSHLQNTQQSTLTNSRV